MPRNQDRQVHHHGPMPASIPIPSGPVEYDTIDGRYVDDDVTYSRYPNDKNEKEIFAYLLNPKDSYTPEGVYWADLPLAQRLKFNYNVEKNEAAREFKAFWSLFKSDPLAPVAWYFRNAVIPGAGLLLEGYVLFSIGNIKSLFAIVYPECWGSKAHVLKAGVCDLEWTYAVNYMEILGIMVGQVLVGLIGDGIGRRWGLIQDAAIMFVGLLMLTAMWGKDLNGWTICYAWSLFFYSIGVGGEYPMTATSGMEKSSFNKISSADDRLHRGRKVTMAFLMQGWGQLLNQGILILLLIIFHHGSGKPTLIDGAYTYSKVATQWTFRVSFAIPAIGTLWLVYFRTYKMPNISAALEKEKGKTNVTGYDVQSLKLLFTHQGGRLFATCFAWFCNDVFFYGNKLFQSTFISVLVPNNKKNGVMTDWLYNLINIGCSMAGYYLASFTIDSKFYGRNWMQQIGFLMCFIFFVVPAFNYKYYTSEEHVHEFQAMYFLSSFFNQFGPNAVTFLTAAEVFPTNIRATAHGMGAAWGKAGALVATVAYNYMTTQQKFYMVPWFGLAGMLVTLIWLPDVTGLDLRALDRRWHYITTGRENEYHGIAIHPRHLSLWERWRGVGKNYNAELDYKQRVDDMRQDWEKQQASKIAEDAHHEDDVDMAFSPDVHHYFLRTSPQMRPATQEKANDDFALPEAESDISAPSEK